jgi:low temperature requirement protein LtrA
MNLFDFNHTGALLVLAYSFVVIMHLLRFRLARRIKSKQKQSIGDKIASYAHLSVLVLFIALGSYSLLRVYKTESIHVHFTIDFTI